MEEKYINIITLGCPRNQVDSEIFNSVASEYGYQICNGTEKADIILINTCGFIQNAKDESITTILSAAQDKKSEALLVVTGCLVKRYEEELTKEIPEVDRFIKLKDYDSFSQLLRSLIRPQKSAGLNNPNSYKKYTRRKLIDKEAYAYLKISDGCNNNCSYCAIPSIRGKVTSDPIDKLISEAESLAKQGIRELIITAMDITQYGKDFDPPVRIMDLLTKLVKVRDIEWIRLLYLHPKGITDELLDFIADNKIICPYLDIPIQHINNDILQSMNRSITREDIETLISKIRNKIPSVSLRTTLIVGYPGETNKEFQELYEFVSETKFNRLGVFTYSREENTPAYSFSNTVTQRTADRRMEKIMRLQETISSKLLARYVGQTLPVIIDSIKKYDDKMLLSGRTQYDTPDVDGTVFVELNNDKNIAKSVAVGNIVNVMIEESWEHDLGGELASPTIIK